MMFIWHLIFLFLTISIEGKTENPKISSAPFISGNTFRCQCDFYIDQWGCNFTADKVKNGTTIFSQYSYLEQFLNDIQPYIKAKYILVTHNGDDSIPGKYASLLDDENLVAWFSVNAEGFSHPKLHPIPIGIGNYIVSDYHVLSKAMKKFSNLPKKYTLYMNFQIYSLNNLQNNIPIDRILAYNLFHNNPLCFECGRKNYKDYLLDLALSKFVLSPRGLGLDCYRTWEALHMGSIPIIKTSDLDSLFEDLPVLIVNEWEEINQDFLDQKYTEIKEKKHNHKKLYIEYWIKILNYYKAKAKENEI